MTHRYVEAAEQYRAALKAGRLPPDGRSLEDVEKAAVEFSQFLISEEGQMARTLLGVSGKSIYFGTLKSGAAETAYSYSWDGEGLCKMYAGRSLVAGSRNPCSPMEAVTAYVEDCKQSADSSGLVKRRNANHFLPWIKALLDFIAAVASADPS